MPREQGFFYDFFEKIMVRDEDLDKAKERRGRGGERKEEGSYCLHLFAVGCCSTPT